MKVRSAVITAAGFGTRFLPIVKEIPKEMLPVIDKPILQYVVEECLDAGIENVVIVVREGNDIIKNYFTKAVPEVRDLLQSVGKEKRFAEVERLSEFKGIQIVNQRDDLPYGNGSPVLSAKPYLYENEPFAALFADDLVLTKGRSALGQLIDYYEQNEPDAVLAAQEVPDSEIERYGVIKPKEVTDDKTGQIEYIVEKPKLEEAPSRLITYGRFVLPYRALEILESLETGLDNELWLQDANSKVAESGKFMYRVIDGEWYTTGDPLRYYEAVTRYYLNDETYGSQAGEVLSKIAVQ